MFSEHGSRPYLILLPRFKSTSSVNEIAEWDAVRFLTRSCLTRIASILTALELLVSKRTCVHRIRLKYPQASEIKCLFNIPNVLHCLLIIVGSAKAFDMLCNMCVQLTIPLFAAYCSASNILGSAQRNCCECGV